ERAGDRIGAVDVVDDGLQGLDGAQPLGLNQDAQDGEQRPARRTLVVEGVLDHTVHVGVDDTCGVVGALDVTTDPEQRLREPREHAALAHCSPWWTVNSSFCRAGAGYRRERWLAGGTAPRKGMLSSLSTQVSFDPPPREELTISSPSPSATRVSPPGRTQTSSPSLTAKGRRSIWRGAIASPTNVGCVDRATGRWAM